MSLEQNHTSSWDELRRLADQLELEIHLGGMEARDRWRSLQPRIAELEHKVRAAGGRIGEALGREVANVRELLRGLKDGIDHPDN